MLVEILVKKGLRMVTQGLFDFLHQLPQLHIFRNQFFPLVAGIDHRRMVTFADVFSNIREGGVSYPAVMNMASCRAKAIFLFFLGERISVILTPTLVATTLSTSSMGISSSTR